MKKKVCIIGFNYAYKTLYQSLIISKKFDVIGISGKKKRKFLNKKSFLYYSSWKKMIINLKPDLVIIGVPPLEQEKILIFLLKNKIDFMCEKPITNDNKKIELFKNLSNKKSHNKIVDLNFLTIPSVEKFKYIVDKININKKSQISVDWLFKPKTLKDNLSWKNHKNKIGGELNNFFFHLVSVLFYFFGNLDISLLSKKNNFYIFSFKSKKISFRANFFAKSRINKFKIEVQNKNTKYSLINNTKDYHNNYFIKKNDTIIFQKNFNKDKSRIYASKKIIDIFLNKKDNLKRYVKFEQGLDIQKKIIDL